MKLIVQPESGSYSITFARESVDSELDGGRGRYRRDIIGGSKKVGMTFILDPDGYDYFMAFYRLQTQHASEPFEMDLIIDESELTECTCNFVPGTLKLAAQSGLAYTVTVEVEVQTPFNPTQDTDDDAIIDAFNTAHGYDPEA